MIRTPTIVACVMAAMLGLAGCASQPADTALELTGTRATWTAADGILTVGTELRNVGTRPAVVGPVNPVAGFEEISTELLFGERDFWIDDPEGLRPAPAEVGPGETARVYVSLQVSDCDVIGDWEEVEQDDTVRFVMNGGESLVVEVWWSDQPEEPATFSLDMTPALEISTLDAKVCR